MTARHLPPERGALHWLFEAGLALKGFLAALESLTGLALLFTANATIQRSIDWLTHNELIEDPTDPMVARVLRLTSRFDAGSQHFYAVYLLSHGLVKLVVIALLVRRIAAAYPLAIVVFAGFVGYQMHRWAVSGSPVMLALSAFDLLVIWLTWREWRRGSQLE
ncbi:DUF2127 domain-containing protein [Paracoccus sp. M683]|uniref:DUF2127 domain-containing protein n=1 Tax=Paracoccus sp. M683 TaxID=2594268 RepID=UPI00163D8839|nr:DUF2127 domain-containing protein [Paracoccus sp. M683]